MIATNGVHACNRGSQCRTREICRLEEFKGWLRQRRLVPENRIPFVVIWVERFLRLRATRPRENWKDSLQAFLQDLEAGVSPRLVFPAPKRTHVSC